MTEVILQRKYFKGIHENQFSDICKKNHVNPDVSLPWQVMIFFLARVPKTWTW